MQLAFEKWHGCKNDFIVVWVEATDDLVVDSLKRQATALCTRDGSGIGADGILILHKSQPKELIPSKLTIINSDGSIAATCGNGIRCAALSVLKNVRDNGNAHDLPELVELSIEGRPVTARFMSRKDLDLNHSSYPLVAVEMGIPKIDNETDFFEQAKAEWKTHAPQIKGELHAVEIGNKHLVCITDLSNVTREMIRDIGPKLQASPHWDGINVHLASQIDISPDRQSQMTRALGGKVEEAYKAVTWERGAGETQACGSGACSIAASVLVQGFVERDNWIGVDMPGGQLFCKYPLQEIPILLAGPSTFIFSGKLHF